ncbi:AAA family ATPase [Halomonas sp.]|uniref:AAA family ATPase n=1 Tax=Halomonas sp. TaxID=1486246 RepID=UPI0035661465
MQLDHLTLENFRACEQLELKLGQRLTVLLGNNGSGKTSLLDTNYIPGLLKRRLRRAMAPRSIKH